MRYEIRQLSIGEILDQSIKVTQDNFMLFMKIALILLLPILLAIGFVSYESMGDIATEFDPELIERGAAQPNFDWTSLIVLGVLFAIYGVVAYPLTNAAITYAVANTYLEKPISVGMAFNRAGKAFIPLILTWLLIVLIMLGIMLPGVLVTVFAGGIGALVLIPLVILLVVFAFWVLLAMQVVVLEGRIGTGAIKRSRELIKGNVGTVFVLGLLMMVIGGGINVIEQLIPLGIASVVVSGVLQTALMIFTAAVWVVFYFSARCKHENFDLTMLAETVRAVEAEDEAPGFSTT